MMPRRIDSMVTFHTSNHIDAREPGTCPSLYPLPYARVYYPCPDAASLHGAGSLPRPLLDFFLATGNKEHSGARRLVSCVQTGDAVVWHGRGA
jgi:hypothetical protein